MNRLKIKTLTGFLGVALILALLSFAPALAKFSDKSVQVTPDSVEGQNVTAAAEFIRRMGDPEKADNILKWMRDGKIYYDPTLSENGDTGTWSKDITVPPTLIQKGSNPTSRSQPFDPERDFSSVATLARVLYHEKIHAHQSWLYLSGSGWGSLIPVVGFTQHETDAWIPTLSAMDKWVNNYYKEYLELPDEPKERRKVVLKKLLQLLEFKIAYLGDFIDNDCYGLDCTTSREWKKSMEGFKKELEKDMESLLPPPDPEEHSSNLNRLLDREREKEREALAQLTPIPTDDQIVVDFTGRGIPAGHALIMSIANNSDYPLKATIPAGMVFVPSDPGYQKMILRKDTHIACAPRQKVTVPLEAFCLDHGKQPPPVPEKDPGIRWSIPDQGKDYANYRKIVLTGDRLAREGKFTQEFQDPGKYGTEVIQRAIWFHATKGKPGEVGREKLAKDLDEQLARLPKEQQPPPEEKEKFVSKVWEHVDLTLKESGGESR